MAQGKSIEAQLVTLGKRLTESGTSKSLLSKLSKASAVLSDVSQSPPEHILSAMQPLMDALVKPELLNHKEEDIRLWVAACLSEVMRIVAPDAPYSDDVLREIFALIVATFKGLIDPSSPYFDKRVGILEMVAKIRSCVVMLDLECVDLIYEMFQTFFETVSEKPENIMISMKTIMCLVIEESEEIQQPILDLLCSMRERKEVSAAAKQLALDVFEQCAKLLARYDVHFKQFIESEGQTADGELQDEFYDLAIEIYKHSPKMLIPVAIRKLAEELVTDKVAARVNAVQTLGCAFTIRGPSVLNEFKQLFPEFIKRFSDKAVEVRLAAVDCAKKYLIANPDGHEAEELLLALSDHRIQDHDDKVRMHVVIAICDLAMASPGMVSADILRRIADRLRDTVPSVRMETLRKLTEVYRTFSLKRIVGLAEEPEKTVELDVFSWIPSKMIMCCFDKGCEGLRPQAMELVLSEELFSPTLKEEHIVNYWIHSFTAFGTNEIKALERVLAQKRRLQMEMHNYLQLQQKLKKEDTEENRKKLEASCKLLSTSFVESANAEEHFHKLSDILDTKLINDLSVLLDPSCSLSKVTSVRGRILERVDKDEYEFVHTLATKCSYRLFGKDHMKALLSQIKDIRGKADKMLLEASVSLLVVFAGHFPKLLEGAEGDVISLLQENNEHVKEGIVQVLAKIGGTMRGQFTEDFNSVDLLEKLCIEGSRKQAKYAVQALAAISSDSGKTVLSALYRKLIDLLETGAHLPTVLQSLGCIAQNCISAFETREEDLVNFLVRDLFRRDSAPVENEGAFEGASETARLKAFGMKALIRSFLPNKDTELRQRVNGVFNILAKFVGCGEISDEIKSSEYDKAYLRLAAGKGVLRLSKQWDSQITPQLFRSTVLLARDPSDEVRSQFLTKVQKCLKEHSIPNKYACALALTMYDDTSDPICDDTKDPSKKANEKLCDFIATCRREARLREASVVYYPEYVLFYLVHILAHDTTFPSLNDEGPTLELLKPYSKQLCFFIWALVSQAREETENVALILSILRTMKQAEDAVDSSKTQNTYVLCDIGIAIMKVLPAVGVSSANGTMDIPLPMSIYKPVEGDASSKDDGSHLPSGFGESEVLSLMLPDQAKRKTQGLLSEGNGVSQNEIPQTGTRQETVVPPKVGSEKKQSSGRKGSQKEKLLPVNDELTSSQMDVDVATSPKRKRGRSSKENGEVSPKAKRARSDEVLPNTQSEKRKRGRPKTSSRKDDDSKDEALSDTPTLNTDPIRDLAAPGINASDDSGKRPIRLNVKKLKLPEDTEESPSERQQAGEEAVLPESVEGKKRGARRAKKIKDDTEEHATPKSEVQELKSPRGTPRRMAKKMSISGLESPDSKSGNTGDTSKEEMVGWRVKVWWPLDKQYYTGVIHSYDASKKKHKVLYDDGDEELLNMGKERWQRITDENDEEENHPATPVSLQSTGRRKKGQEKRDAKGSVTKRRATKSPKPRKAAKGDSSAKHATSPEGDHDDSSNASEGNPELAKDVEVGDGEHTPNAGSKRNLKASGRSEKKGSSGAKIGNSKQDDGPKGTPSPTASKDSDDVPLDAWKTSSRRKVH